MGLEYGLPENMRPESEKKKDDAPTEAMIPGLDWSSEERKILQAQQQQKTDRRKQPYSKPIPKSFEQAWEKGLTQAEVPAEPENKPPSLLSLDIKPPSSSSQNSAMRKDDAGKSGSQGQGQSSLDF